MKQTIKLLAILVAMIATTQPIDAQRVTRQANDTQEEKPPRETKPTFDGCVINIDKNIHHCGECDGSLSRKESSLTKYAKTKGYQVIYQYVDYECTSCPHEHRVAVDSSGNEKYNYAPGGGVHEHDKETCYKEEKIDNGNSYKVTITNICPKKIDMAIRLYGTTEKHTLKVGQSFTSTRNFPPGYNVIVELLQ